MTGGLSLPCPVHNYRNKDICENLGICAGLTGFSVSRHAHIHFKSTKVTLCAWSLKTFFVLWFIWEQFFVEKGYLKFAHTEGISRMQLQHPVKACNPLTQKRGGCATEFKNVRDLPYCTQSGDAGKNVKQEKCQYFDEFDMRLPGYQETSVLIPTRRTKYVQEVNCAERSFNEPCPRTDQLKPKETVYVADIEDFTLLIDHSFVNDELKCEKRAWEMLGFVNPCGKGAELEAKGGLRKAKDMLKSMVSQYAEVEECEHQNFMPIHRQRKLLSEEESNREAERDKGFSMWMSSQLDNFFPWLQNPKALAKHNPAKFDKIKNGDFIKVKDLLELSGVDLDHADNNHGAHVNNTSNRFEGVVIIISIHYTNWKEGTWPNKVDPAYFYSFAVAPADEYKVMQNTMARIAQSDVDGIREIHDYHGIFIVIKQSGCMGILSYRHVFVLFLGIIFIEGMYRSLLLCFFLNVEGYDQGKKKDDTHGEVEHVVTEDFHLYGDRADRGPHIVTEAERVGYQPARRVETDP